VTCAGRAALTARRMRQRTYRHGLHVEGQRGDAVVRGRREEAAGRLLWRLPHGCGEEHLQPYHQGVCICHHVCLGALSPAAQSVAPDCCRRRRCRSAAPFWPLRRCSRHGAAQDADRHVARALSAWLSFSIRSLPQVILKKPRGERAEQLV
jgi:hypothetical protein